MEPANLKTLFEKVETIAHGSRAGLLNKLIDMLYEGEMQKAQIAREEVHQAAIRPRSGAYR